MCCPPDSPSRSRSILFSVSLRPDVSTHMTLHRINTCYARTM